jgi:hypothetical protein
VDTDQNVRDPQHWFEVNNSHLLGSSQKTALEPLALALFTASFTQSFTEKQTFTQHILNRKRIKVDNISMYIIAETSGESTLSTGFPFLLLNFLGQCFGSESP